MLQHIMKLATDNGLHQFNILSQATLNVANINTNGYKTRRFDHYLTSDNRLDGVVRYDYSQGPIMMTTRELDVAIDGEGFIPVTGPDGKVAYTRDGSFGKNSEGYLVTNWGDLVGNGIQLPGNYKKLFIQKDGAVEVLMPGKQTAEQVGKIDLVTFRNLEGLKLGDNNRLLPTDDSGGPVAVTSGTEIKQGNLERSNVNVFHQVDHVLRLNAGIISNLRIVKFTDDIYRQAVNLRQ
ncbi:MAG: flagellar hook basal-body protein [Vampirovibrio sp.]|nr:flagellar hook basal-body protein [Vampirovibrio sp.]